MTRVAQSHQVSCVYETPGADAINISGLLNPKKLGHFKNQMLKKNCTLDLYFLEI
jgi:hypothetical protein